MKKLKKVLVTMLACLTVGAVGLGMASCETDEIGGNNSTNSSSPLPNGGGTTPTPDDGAETPNGELEYTLSKDETYYEVSGIGTCTDTDIVIPSTYKGLPVKSIAYTAFAECYSVTSVVIGDSVTSIGWGAFGDCESLTSVVIGGAVTSIGEYAFHACTSLSSITFEGTMEQWNAIGKSWGWRDFILATAVVCSDGEVALQ